MECRSLTLLPRSLQRSFISCKPDLWCNPGAPKKLFQPKATFLLTQIPQDYQHTPLTTSPLRRSRQDMDRVIDVEQHVAKFARSRKSSARYIRFPWYELRILTLHGRNGHLYRGNVSYISPTHTAANVTRIKRSHETQGFVTRQTG